MKNTCRQQATYTSIPIFKSPAIIAGFLGFTSTVKAATDALIENLKKRCETTGPYNYMILSRFIVSYNIDQADRMAVINKISRSLSESKDDFTDIDGNSVKAGIQATLEPILLTLIKRV